MTAEERVATLETILRECYQRRDQGRRDDVTAADFKRVALGLEMRARLYWLACEEALGQNSLTIRRSYPVAIRGSHGRRPVDPLARNLVDTGVTRFEQLTGRRVALSNRELERFIESILAVFNVAGSAKAYLKLKRRRNRN